MMEIKTVLRTVLSEAELKPASAKLERPKRRAVTMVPAHGVRVIRTSPTRGVVPITAVHQLLVADGSDAIVAG